MRRCLPALLLLTACGTTPPPAPPPAAPEPPAPPAGRPETRQLPAADAVGYDGAGIRRAVDRTLDARDAQQKALDDALRDADGR